MRGLLKTKRSNLKKAKYIALLLPIILVFNSAFVKCAAASPEAVPEQDPLFGAMEASVAGMMLHSERMKIISQNIANSEVTGSYPGALPYRRKVTYVKGITKNGVTLPVADSIGFDYSDFKLKYEPGHPAADARGYVKYPNVDMVVETVDAKEAQRSFDAGVHSLSISKNMAYRALETIK